MSNLLEVSHLKKYFKTPNGFLHAVDDVSFSIEQGKTLGVVGESGCGKSTLGRVILGLTDATSGSILFEGDETVGISKKRRFQLRKDMQMVFQDPFSSLDPRMCVSELIEEPLIIYKTCANAEDRYNRVSELMQTVGLAERLRYSYPHELDGGRRQRIGIARALALNPKFIVCDEPVSALDVSIQAQILNLMQDLQEQHGLTYIFITHDLSVVRHISDKIMVMYLGCTVELCDAKSLFHQPLHPYTKGLLSAIPRPVIHTAEHDEEILTGELVSPINPKPGCRFAPRCRFATEACFREQPSLREFQPGHFVACHHVEGGVV